MYFVNKYFRLLHLKQQKIIFIEKNRVVSYKKKFFLIIKTCKKFIEKNKVRLKLKVYNYYLTAPEHKTKLSISW